jgi:hypothetical protein
MAQHIQLDTLKEAKIFSEVQKIGKLLYADMDSIGKYVVGKPFENFEFAEKKIKRLTDEYNMFQKDDSVFHIGLFSLEEDWKEDSWLTKNTFLDCHFDKNGNVNGIFIVL